MVAAARHSEKSAGAESEEPTPKRPRLDSVDGHCWFRGDATRAGGSVSLSHNQIADRLSSTLENPQAANRTPTPDSASAKHMIRKRLEDQTRDEEGACLQYGAKFGVSVPTFNQHVDSDGLVMTRRLSD